MISETIYMNCMLKGCFLRNNVPLLFLLLFQLLIKVYYCDPLFNYSSIFIVIIYGVIVLFLIFVFQICAVYKSSHPHTHTHTHTIVTYRGNIYTCQNFISIVLANTAIRLSYPIGWWSHIDGIIPRIDFHDQIAIRFPVYMNRMTGDGIDASVKNQSRKIFLQIQLFPLIKDIVLVEGKKGSVSSFQ